MVTVYVTIYHDLYFSSYCQGPKKRKHSQDQSREGRDLLMLMNTAATVCRAIQTSDHSNASQ